MRKLVRVSSENGALIYTALIIMVIVFFVVVIISEGVSMLRYHRRESLREEQLVVLLDNTIQEGISYVQSLPYEEINRTKGIYTELIGVEFPGGWVMLDERCGFIASLISLSGYDAVWEVWARCNFAAMDRVEKVKVKLSMMQL